VQISFTVGPGLNRLNLWKLTIDAPGQILGAPPAPAPGHHSTARRGLSLPSCVDLAMGNHMLIAIAGAHTRT